MTAPVVLARAALVAVVGHPNAGKTSLFNALTGARQRVGNFPGVTVERTSAKLQLDGHEVELVDLPGAYSLVPRSPDEAVTRDVLMGRLAGERRPDLVLLVLDSTNLTPHLRFALEVAALGLPLLVALNRIDMARRDGTEIDRAALEARLGVPVVETVAVRRHGLDALRAALARLLGDGLAPPDTTALPPTTDVRALARAARALAGEVVTRRGASRQLTDRIDRVVLHPLAGPVMLAAVLFLLFQAVFALAEAPMGWIEDAFAGLQGLVTRALAPGLMREALSDGLIAGVGSVVVFLPQILILFALLLLIEGSGYMARAAFLVDRLMARAGLSGGSFIPLLSSFACAIPGIMAARTVADPRARLTTILVAPLMTCSARLPVYAVIIAAFIPPVRLGGWIGLQGLVLFGLYAAGLVAALLAARLLRRTLTRGPALPFLIELPAYERPRLKNIAVGLWLRAGAFLKRAGTLILAANMALWLLVATPRVDGAAPPLAQSRAGQLGQAIAPLVQPLGFGPDIAIALVPAMAAREIAISALGTVYAVEADDADARGLVERLRSAWPLPTALAFLAWFVFAPQCLSTLMVARRETGSWRWPFVMLAYLFALAWVAAFLTYRVAGALA